jgi:hypothetical protein
MLYSNPFISFLGVNAFKISFVKVNNLFDFYFYILHGHTSSVKPPCAKHHDALKYFKVIVKGAFSIGIADSSWESEGRPIGPLGWGY